MDRFAEEVEAALQEGITIEPLTSPVRIIAKRGRLEAVEFIKNRLGDPDESGRPKPFPMPGSEHIVPIDTLIVAISEGSDTDCVAVAGANRLEVKANGTVVVDPQSLTTNRPGVFAGGDVVTGPNTVVDAIATGKRVANVIDRFLRAEPLVQPAKPRMPEVYVAPPLIPEGEVAPSERAELPRLAIHARRRSFAEVEMALDEKEACQEALRCLRCDLTFTREQADGQADGQAEEGGRA